MKVNFPPFPTFQSARLVVVAARPAMGKTRFLCALSDERANSHPVLFHSLEFSEKQIRNRCESEGENIIVDDSPWLTFEEFADRVRSVVSEKGVKTVVVDYVNLFKGFDSETILRSLKSLAEDLDIEIIAGVAVERRKDGSKDPTVALTDIKMGSTDAIDEFIPLESRNHYLIS